MTITNSQNGRILIFEGLRGWLALWVMAFHLMAFSGAQGQGVAQQNCLSGLLFALTHGKLPVSLFMLLSGYCIFRLIDTSQEHFGHYIVRRWLRIFPAFILCFFLGVVLANTMERSLESYPGHLSPWLQNQKELVATYQAHYWPNLFSHILLLHGLIPDNWWTGSTDAFLGVGWSIATEWQFYLLAPLLLYIVKRKYGHLLISVIVILLVLAEQAGWFNHFVNNMPALILIQAPLFYVGGTTYLLLQMRKSSKTGEFLNYGIMLNALIVVGWSIALDNQFVYPIFIWLFLLFFSDIEHPTSLSGLYPLANLVFLNPVILYIGRISYSIYLFHWIAIIITLKLITLFHWPSTWQFTVALCGGGLILSIAGAHFMYNYVERPFNALGRNLTTTPTKHSSPPVL